MSAVGTETENEKGTFTTDEDRLDGILPREEVLSETTGTDTDMAVRDRLGGDEVQVQDGTTLEIIVMIPLTQRLREVVDPESSRIIPREEDFVKILTQFNEHHQISIKVGLHFYPINPSIRQYPQLQLPGGDRNITDKIDLQTTDLLLEGGHLYPIPIVIHLVLHIQLQNHRLRCPDKRLLFIARLIRHV
jgi:hypothetical protein